MRRGSKAPGRRSAERVRFLLSLERSAASVYYKYNKSLNTYMGSDASYGSLPRLKLSKMKMAVCWMKVFIVSVMTCAAPMLERNGMERD